MDFFDRRHLEHEIKFLVSSQRLPSVLACLSSLCSPDPDHPSNAVFSIYYDTRNLASLEEKRNSDFFKTKIRLRWYEGRKQEGRSPTFLELKYRLGSQRKKVRIETRHSASWLSAVSLDDPVLLTVPSLLRESGFRPPGGLSPILANRYRRRRFIDPLSRSRICLDSDISLQRVNTQLLPHKNSFGLRLGVLEIKNQAGEMPRHLRPLLRLGSRLSSFSKYGACAQAALSTCLVHN